MSVDGLPRAFASWKRGTREDAEVEAGCASTKSSGWRSGGWTYMHERERCVPSVESSDGIRTYKFPCFVRSQRPCRVGPVCLPGSLMGEEMELIGHNRIEIATQRNWPIVTLHQSKRKLDGNTDESSASAAQTVIFSSSVLARRHCLCNCSPLWYRLAHDLTLTKENESRVESHGGSEPRLQYDVVSVGDGSLAVMPEQNTRRNFSITRPARKRIGHLEDIVGY